VKLIEVVLATEQLADEKGRQRNINLRAWREGQKTIA
jgi:hypothetical protein